MTLTPGEIYFIREKDFFTNTPTDFVKVGLVREKDARTSADRLSEHQTGNPRPLYIHHVIRTPAVDRIEALLHRMFATNRVPGEWFKFNDLELENVIQTAQSLANDAEKTRPLFERADELDKLESNGTTIATTEIVLAHFLDYHVQDATVKYLKGLDNQIKAIWRGHIEAGKTIGGAAKIEARKGKWTFNTSQFKKDHPDLSAEFSESKDRWYHSFLPKKMDSAEVQGVLENKVYPIGAEIQQHIEEVQNGTMNAASLNQDHLILLENIALAEWEKLIAIAQLKFDCDTNDGIEGICAWKRNFRPIVSLDSIALTEMHPELAKKYVEFKESKGALKAEGRIAGGQDEQDSDDEDE